MIQQTIAKALYHYLSNQLHNLDSARQFFRLDGFDESTYQELLRLAGHQEGALGQEGVWLKTTARIKGYEDHVIDLDAGKSATWYRNNVPTGYALVLIFNEYTSDAQSLKNFYPITERLLATEGIDDLIRSSFVDYQLPSEQLKSLKSFIARVRKNLFQPQLRDLTAFLIDVNARLYNNAGGVTLEAAIAESLPCLGMFRCGQLASVLNTSRADRLLRENYNASLFGRELLDDTQQQKYLERLESVEFDDDSPYGGASPQEKRELLHRFLTDVVAGQDDMSQVLAIDWQEASQVLHKTTRTTKRDQRRELAEALEAALQEQQFNVKGLPEVAQDALQELRDGREPNDDGIGQLIGDYGDNLPKALTAKLRRLRGTIKRSSHDFISGVTQLAIELLSSVPDEMESTIGLRVSFNAPRTGKDKAKETEALLAFCTMHRGVEKTIPSIDWQLDALWQLVDGGVTALEQEELDEGEEREKAFKIDLPFDVHVANMEGEIIERAQFIWQYNSSGPLAATLANIQAEASLLTKLQQQEHSKNRGLRIPAYCSYQESDDVTDIDLSKPISSLGTWYYDQSAIIDLHEALREELQPVARPDAWVATEAALTVLEQTWAKFVSEALAKGILEADLDGLLNAYQEFLRTATTHLQQGQEAMRGFRLITQAWVIGPKSFDEWAVVPFIHPFKLHWWRERARYFNTLIVRLCDPLDSAPIIDEANFRKEIRTAFSSAGIPAVLALPGRERRPHYFVPVHEYEGYELFRSLQKANLAYGLDPDLVSEDESEQAAQTTAREIARIIQDYIETYPFVLNGLEIYLVQCRNGALPGALVEQLEKLAKRRDWLINLTVIVHTEDRGVPLYQRVVEWLKTHEEYVERSAADYFPRVTLKVLQCTYEELYGQADDTDIVILADVLAEKGQELQAETNGMFQPISLNDYLPPYRSRQMPFERREFTRDVQLTPLHQPVLMHEFYRAQWIARERRALEPNDAVQFSLNVSLQDWDNLLVNLHRRFNWVVCYDPTIDRFLLEATLLGEVQVIRYSLGLGTKHRHNLTVSSSNKAQNTVIRRLTTNLQQLLPNMHYEHREQVAQRLVDEAKQVSGDIVLRAAGPGAYLNELIGMVVAKHFSEARYEQEHSNSLTAWIYLDDFAQWFNRRIPDLLFVSLSKAASGQITLYMELLETKCIGEAQFAHEATDAQQQVAQGINRLAQAWAPGANHLDAPYWYHQLYQAVVGNLAVHREQIELWEEFQERLPRGDYELIMSGHSWIFCYDGSAGVTGLEEHGNATVTAPDIDGVPHRYHHYGRAGLRRLLQELVGGETPVGAWSEAGDVVQEVAAIETPQTGIPQPETVEDPNEYEEEADSHSVDETVDNDQSELKEWLAVKANELARALRDYDISVRPIDAAEADVGPSVVRFKIRLFPGEKLSRIQNIASDLQRELALTSAPFIDNVAGTRYVGLDLPRPKPIAVPLVPQLQMLPPTTIPALPFMVGTTPSGDIVVTDLSSFPHMLVAGSTGSGKTIFLYSLLVSLLYQFGPDELSLLLIDPKQTDFIYFEGLPHLLSGHVIIDPEEAVAWLEEITAKQIDERSLLLREARSRDIKDYNTRTPHNPLKPIVIIIDEYADLVQVLTREHRASFEHELVRLAQRARNVGIHLVIATQRPTADIVTSNLKTNLPARVAFRLPSYRDSMVVLDQAGAENLLGRGDMLFIDTTKGQTDRLQGFFIDPEELDAFTRSRIKHSQ